MKESKNGKCFLLKPGDIVPKAKASGAPVDAFESVAYPSISLQFNVI